MSLMIPAGDLQLEALLREPQDVIKGAAVFCHPHPLYGGTMDNRVVYRAAKAALEAGFAALRFNFRGVGLSSGHYDQGVGEREDAAAAISWLEEKYPALPLALVGYSFGAWVGLRVGCPDPRIKAMVALALPLDLYDFEFLYDNSKPALYISGTRDEFCSNENLNRLDHRLPASSSLHRIEGAEHFFTGYIETLQDFITDFFRSLKLEQNTP
jgi:alpha/beta superfamily hydrolase